MTRRRFQNLALSGSLGLAALAAPGCGDDTGLGARYKVTGNVTYQGKPLEAGQITFKPAEPNDNTREATGTISEGYYSLTTAIPDDGALPGDYLVMIVAKDVDDSAVKATINKQGGGARQHEVAKAQVKAKSLIPPKYQLTDTSGLTAKVAEQSNSIDFELKD